MTSENPAVEHYLSQFSAVEANLPGRDLAWLGKTRQGALEHFARMGFPGSRQEDWRYTRVAPIEKRTFRPLGESDVSIAGDQVQRHLLDELECERLVFVDGRYAETFSVRSPRDDGVRVTSLAHALREPSPLLESHLGRYAGSGRHAFSALNTAFMADGAVIHVGKGSDVRRPVHLLFIATSEDVVAHPRILVVAEAGSRVAIIENYAGLGNGCYFTNALTEIALMEDARVDHFKLQQESTKAFHIATLQVRQDRASRFASHSVSFGAQLARNDINVLLDAEGVRCTLNGLFMTDGRQHVDNHTIIDHAKPQGSSDENYKGILSGRSRGVFNGRINVHPDAQKTDAHQSNDNLLLSRDAEIDTKPELEIYADDVKCSHGATVGQLDEHALYYLRSRGIGEAEGRGLLTYGFAHDILDRVEIPALRAKLTDALLQRMPEAFRIREMVQ